MKKRTLALLLAVAMLFTVVLSACGGNDTSSTGSTDSSSSSAGESSGEAESKTDDELKENVASAGITTDIGTPRNETLIVETQSSTDVPGQFNTFMSGTQAGFGIHQLMSCHLWEMDTVAGEQYGEVAETWEPNDDFTEWTVKVREGIKWSDGEALDANDVAFTFNMIKDNDAIGASSYVNMYIDKVEVVDDYTVKFTMTEPFPRLALCFGVTVWGCDYRIVPEHIYSQQSDVTMFKDEQPVVAGPYTVHSYDNLGKWCAFQLRDDWKDSTLGIVGEDHYGTTGTPPKYVWFRNLSDEATKQMAIINNEVDILCEVTPEMLTAMTAANDKIQAWYPDFPYANLDDPGSKGITFSMGKGAPYDNKDFRWGICLALDIDNLSENIFDGIGRAAAIPLMNHTSAMVEFYEKPMLDWLKDFELDLGDGTTFKPFDDGYAARMAEKKGVTGSDEELKAMFGEGWWKHDAEAAEKLLIKAGLEKKDDGWYFEGKKFTCEMSYLADGEFQAGRGLQAAYNQLLEFGLDVTLTSKSTSTWDSDGGTGNFEIGGYWPSGGITRDIYRQFSGFTNDLIKPVGETGSGYGGRWDSQEATDIIKKLANLDPDSDEAYELGQEFFKICVEEMPVINFHNGTKFVPTNSTYWEGYPDASNAYDGPWWWWSCFKYQLPHITPVQNS